jgi:hypothetical protein
MDYKFILITPRDRAIDPAFIYSFEVSELEDFANGLRETVTEWKRRNPDQDLLGDSVTFLIEQYRENTCTDASNSTRHRSPSRNKPNPVR